MSFNVIATDATGSQSLKACDISILPVPFDWSQLLWGVPGIIIGFSGGTATFVPNSVMSDSAAATANAVLERCMAFNTAFLAYNGPAVNCNANVTWNKTGFNYAIMSIYVRYVSGPARFLDLTEADTLVNGVYNFPFVLPDTLGVPEVIEVGVDLESGDPFGVPPPAPVAMSMTLT